METLPLFSVLFAGGLFLLGLLTFIFTLIINFNKTDKNNEKVVTVVVIKENNPLPADQSNE